MEGLLIAARFFHFTSVIMLTGVFAFERPRRRPGFPAIRRRGCKRGGTSPAARLAGLDKPGARDRLGCRVARRGRSRHERKAARDRAVARRRRGRADPHAVRRGLATAVRLGRAARLLSGSARKAALARWRSDRLDGAPPRRGDAGEFSLGRATVRQHLVPPGICTSPRTSFIYSPRACGWGPSRP